MAIEHLGFYALLLVAEVLGTVGGFGSSMLVVPLAGWFMPFDQALGLTALFHVFSNGAKMVLFRQGISRELLLWLGAPAVVGVLIGARLTVLMDERVLAFAMGAVLVGLGAALLLRSGWRMDPSRSNASAGGVLSGFLAGLAGTGGAIRGLTLAAFGLEKSVFVSTSAWIDMGVDMSRTLVYASQGFVTSAVLVHLPAMAVVSVAGSWAGRGILARVPQDRFRTVVLILVIAMGLATIAQGLRLQR